MPLVSKTFNQLLDFTRTTSGTFVGSNGLIQTTPASVNLLTQTQQFDNAAWGKSNATVTANTTVAPDGTSTADTLVENTAVNVFHQTSQNFTSTAATTYSYSVFLKANTRNTATIMLGAGANFVFFAFNLSAGTVGAVQYVGSTWSNGTASITNVGNGWYRCVISGLVSNAAAYAAVVEINEGANRQYTGDGTSGIFIWGAQLEAASAATTYTRNNGGVFPPRFDYDPVTLAPKGLMVEEQRTNLLVRSAEFDSASWFKSGATVTANSVAAPDGTTTADTIVLGTVGNLILQDCPTTVDGTYVFSIYLRAPSATTVVLTIQQSGGGASSLTCALTTSWQRFEISRALTTLTFVRALITTNSNTPTLYAWGAQVEAGAFATSYIPTVASQVTRTADQTSIVAPNFAPWYNQSEGTFVADYDVLVSANTTAAHVLAATTASTQNNINRIWMWNGTPGLLRNTVNSGGVNSAELTGPTVAANTVYKSASAYRVNDFAFVTNGGAVATDTSGATPVGLTLLGIGQRGDSVEYLNGHIRSIRYYPTRLTNAQLQALTA